MVKAVDYIIGHPLTGLLHLTNGQAISKYELLGLFAEIWGKKDLGIEPDDSHVADRSLICTRQDFARSIPSYRTMLEDMHAFMNVHSELYSHYAAL